MAKSIDTSPQPLTDEVLQTVADLGCVPASQREFFFESVRQIVQTACELDGLVKQGLTSKSGQNFVGAALSFYDALGNLNKHERALIEGILGGKAKFIFERISSGGVVGLDKTAYQLALLSSLVTGRPPPRYPSQPPDPPQRGRRSGTVMNWIFQNFVSQLYISTVAADGSLTFEKDTPAGDWVKAIRALEPYLPEGFVPKSLSGSTLHRLKAACTRAVKQADEEDRLSSDNLP
jgi:hypothetical protein